MYVVVFEKRALFSRDEKGSCLFGVAIESSVV